MSMANSVPGDWVERPGEHPLWTLNRDMAEWIAGPQPGRPTISRRTGRIISRVAGIPEDQAVDLFHLVLVVGAATGAVLVAAGIARS